MEECIILGHHSSLDLLAGDAWIEGRTLSALSRRTPGATAGEECRGVG